MICQFLIVLFVLCFSLSYGEEDKSEKYRNIAIETKSLIEQNFIKWEIEEDVLVKKEKIESVTIETHKVVFSNGVTYQYWYGLPRKPIHAVLSIPGAGTTDSKNVAVGFGKEGYAVISYCWWQPNSSGTLFNEDAQKDRLYDAIMIGLTSGEILKRRNPDLTASGFFIEGTSYGGIIAAWIASLSKDVKAISVHASTLDIISLKGQSRLLANTIPTDRIARFQPDFVFKKKIPLFAILRSMDEFFPLEEVYKVFSDRPMTTVRIIPNVDHEGGLPVSYFSLVGSFFKSIEKFPLAKRVSPVIKITRNQWFEKDIKVSCSDNDAISHVYVTQSSPFETAYFRELKQSTNDVFTTYLNSRLNSYFIVDVQDRNSAVVSSYVIRQNPSIPAAN